MIAMVMVDEVCIHRYLPVRVSGDRRQNVDVESISFGQQLSDRHIHDRALTTILMETQE